MSDDIHAERRRRLMQTFRDGLILVRGRGPEGVSASFRYLTGLAEPAAALVLAPRGARVGTGRRHPGPDYVRGRSARQVLFLPEGDPLAARWGEDSSATLGAADAARLGVDELMPVSLLDETLGAWLSVAPALHLVRAWPASLSGPDNEDTRTVERVRQRFLGVRLGDATPAVHAMRRLKDAAEQAAIARSIDVTREALDALVGALRPGLREHELEAEIARVYRAHGGTHAFEPIVGCGANALKLHYTANDGPVEAGRLLLVDTGVSIAGYKSDITRTFPVDGRFTRRQREVYDVVLRAQDEAIALCRPGATIGEIHARAWEVIAEAGYGGSDLPHGIGHHLGLETHDVGDVHAPLATGAVVTIEPGLYLAEEGLGVRIEDDVLVTDAGPRLLSEAIPRTAAAVEGWIAGRRA